MGRIKALILLVVFAASFFGNNAYAGIRGSVGVTLEKAGKNWILKNGSESVVRVHIVELYSDKQTTREIRILEPGGKVCVSRRSLNPARHILYGVYIQNMQGINIGWVDTSK
ncbi:hypothetical protein ACFL2R_02665 [Patescibacteria group bacterium]